MEILIGYLSSQPLLRAVDKKSSEKHVTKSSEFYEMSRKQISSLQPDKGQSLPRMHHLT